ncbi:stage II sporulation protein D [Desulfuribacillus alkaliarsenatis]|uniref:Stage II sporulation protein D n=1 Tax=Desulfuribacillus alkaliarsenatis TaxID=766136 RepID=A0A1E5G2N5_9FIRM|nr:stage II sporulation protein D [Desulfuribacillus alkaliarsenatis]OEF96791.1 stage II sporulation protein D [Desulfuribacillus alkaliarsenatis]
MNKLRQYQSIKERLKKRRYNHLFKSPTTSSPRKKVIIATSLGFIITMLLIIGIPSIALWVTDPKIEPIELELDEDGFMVQLHRSKEDIIVELPLEQYIRGVVAAEMPASFEMEALKAQALAARTYFINKWITENRPISDDFRIDQAYYSDDELKIRWGGSYQEYSNKINQAINETKGMILTFNQQPIEAYYFSTSNGFTENSEDVWSAAIPYLRSVESPWDTISPNFQVTKSIPISEVHEKLGLAIPVTAWNGGGDQMPRIVATKRSNAQRIIEMQIGDQTFSGREVRERLGLNSTHFTISIKDGKMHFTTYGYGHGVGMSQWGAEAMARDGMKAEDITRYFYQGTDIEPYIQIASLLPKIKDTIAATNEANQVAQTDVSS